MRADNGANSDWHPSTKTRVINSPEKLYIASDMGFTYSQAKDINSGITNQSAVSLYWRELQRLGSIFIPVDIPISEVGGLVVRLVKGVERYRQGFRVKPLHLTLE